MLAYVFATAAVALVWSLFALKSRMTFGRLFVCCLSAEAVVGAGFTVGLECSNKFVPQRLDPPVDVPVEIHVVWSPNGVEDLEMASAVPDGTDLVPAAKSNEQIETDPASPMPVASSPQDVGNVPETASQTEAPAVVSANELPPAPQATMTEQSAADSINAAADPTDSSTTAEVYGIPLSALPDSPDFDLAQWMPELTTKTVSPSKPAVEATSANSDDAATPRAPSPSQSAAATHPVATVDVAGSEGKGVVATKSLLPKPTTNRVVFVIDHSGSMSAKLTDQETYLTAVLGRLVDLIVALPPDGEFEVIMFDDQQSSPLGPTIKLRRLGDLDENTIKESILSVVPSGGTEPVPALMEAFALQPDEVVFLTDGEFGISDAELEQLLDARQSAKLSFTQVSGTPALGMKKLADACSTPVRVIKVPDNTSDSK